jgi:large subunit ribosomal protein L25
MAMLPLSATVRDLKTKPSHLRAQGQVPGVLYGPKAENLHLSCTEIVLLKTFAIAGENTLVELDLGSKKVPVLFHGVQFDPVTDRLTHVDFYAVDLTQDIEVPVPVHYTGESSAVKDHNGIVVTAMDHVTVRCLPTKLPKEFVVDLSVLTELHQTFSVADLQTPEGVTIVNEPTDVLVVIQERRQEEAAAPVAATPAEGEAGAATPVAEGDKKDEEKKD